MSGFHFEGDDKKYWDGVVEEGINTLRRQESESLHFKTTVEDASKKLNVPKGRIRKYIKAEYKGNLEELQSEMEDLASLKENTNVVKVA